MCENPDSKTIIRKLEERVLIECQRGKGKLEVDGRNAYTQGKAVPIELWRSQSFAMGLPADLYLEIIALASNEAGKHVVSHGGQEYLVDVNGLVESKYGLHREVKSVSPYQSRGQNKNN